MPKIRSGDVEVVYEALGEGKPVVLLHPFPVHREFWKPVATALSRNYRLILPDLRGHGDTEVGEGPATMEKHAADLARVLDDAGVSRAIFVGVSIGGYVLWEFWRRYRERVAGLILADTKAQADTAEGRAGRLKAAADVLELGTEPYFQSMLPKLMGQTTHRTRPDLVDAAHRMMQKMSAADVSQVLRGMAERSDSVATLTTINVPTLVLVGEEDPLTPISDAELMRQGIAGAELKVISRAGHYAPFEQAEEVGKLVRAFVERVG